jgi:hypothetical protein
MSNLRLKLNIDLGTTADASDLETSTLQLHNQLLELEVQEVALVTDGEKPAAAKVGDPITWGALLVTFAAAGGVLTTLINALLSWLSQDDRRSITLEIGGDKLEVKGLSPSEQRKLVDEWLKRHQQVLLK